MAEYNYENVKVEIRDGIAWTLLNRPDKRNAMSPDLHHEMDDALANLAFDDDAKVIVIGGMGGHFSAGQDLKLFFRDMEGKPRERRRASESAHRWRWERLWMYDKPTIAMVEGYCIGGAFTQLIACDFAIAADDAHFCLSEVNWGILPGGLVAKALADCILPRHAMYYSATGDAFDGKEAERIGLVNFSVPQEQLRAKVTELATKLMAKSAKALRGTKQAVRTARGMETTQAYDYLLAKSQAITIGDKENSYQQGLKQFLDEKSYKPALEPFKLGDARKK